MPYPLPQGVFQTTPRQNTSGHIMAMRGMLRPMGDYIPGTPQLIAEPYALQAGMFPPMPNGQRLKIIWEAAA